MTPLTFGISWRTLTAYLFAAAGDEGKVYKVSPDGKTSVVYADEQSRPFCLAPAGGDAVYVGAGPHGEILRVDAAGKMKVVCETGEPYVWSLAVDPTGTLYAGTGPHGRIYRISPEGKGEVLYAAKQDHVLCVAVAPNGTVYAEWIKADWFIALTPGKGVRALSGGPGGGSHSESDGGRALRRHQHAN